MYKPYKSPVTRVFPDVKLPQPYVLKPLIPLIRPLGKIYLFLIFGMAKIVPRNDTVLFDSFKRALSGGSRCIIAFRHSCGGEPQLLAWFFLFKLRALAVKKGIVFTKRPHALFVYGYEAVRWGGWVTRFIMPRLGAMPVYHTKTDSKSMDRIYQAAFKGQYPLALAPEGQVSYITDSVPRLESGVIRIGFFTARQMEKKGLNIPVEILPVSFHFHYDKRGRRDMEKLLSKIEKLAGFVNKGRKELPFTERLRQCRGYILELCESRYSIKADTSLSFEERLNNVITAAMETAERMLGLKSEGDFFYRMYRLRQTCWDRIFLPDIDSLEDMPCIKRGIMDLRAGEAWYTGRHQEIVDFSWYFRVPLPAEDTPIHGKIEYVQNLWDFANRCMGGTYADRKIIAPSKIIIRAAPVINLCERLGSYKNDKKAAVARALLDLEKAYLDNIEVNKQELK
jgi:hypothetical protein